jgi:hypothetical protein
MKSGELLAISAFMIIVISVGLALAGPGTLVGKAWTDALNASHQSISAPSTGGSSVVGSPSLSGDYINKVLSNAGSPAVGTGQSLYDLSIQYGIDDAYALAVFNKESSLGKFGAGADNHSLGNIVCARYSTCNGRFRWYPDWQTGYADFYRLIKTEYIARGLTTVDTITPVYAPPSENDTTGYEQAVKTAMTTYRQESAA